MTDGVGVGHFWAELSQANTQFGKTAGLDASRAADAVLVEKGAVTGNP